MPRSSRHKSSKRSSREAKDYSDSGLREKKGEEESSVTNRAGKDSASGEKRKADSKSIDNRDLGVSGNLVEEYGGSSSKKRKVKVDDDRWVGGEDEREAVKNERHLKSKLSRREGSSGVHVDGDDGKRSGSKGEIKHHRSDRKDKGEKEAGSERERERKEVSKIVRSVDGEAGADVGGGGGSRKVDLQEDGAARPLAGNTGFSAQDDMRKSEDEEFERRVRRKSYSSAHGERYQDGVHEFDDKRISSRDESAKSRKYKDEVPMDKYKEDVVTHNRRQDEKQRDGRPPRDYTGSRLDDKHLRNEKKELDMQQKKSKPQGGDRDHERTHKNCERQNWEQECDDRGHDLGRDRHRDRDRHRGRDHVQGYNRSQALDRDRDRDRDQGHNWDCNHYPCDRDRDRTRDWDHNDRNYTSHADSRILTYKEKTRKKSPEYYEDYRNDKSRGEKINECGNEKSGDGKIHDYHDDKPRNAKVEGDRDGERSQSRKGPDSIPGSNGGRSSPGSKSHAAVEKIRDGSCKESKHGDSMRDVIGVSEAHDKVFKYRLADKHTKYENNHLGDFSAERTPGTIMSPMGLKDRSPSTSVDRRFVNKSRRHSLDVDEAERRSTGSNDVRDGSVAEDRLSRDLSSKKYLAEEYFQVESPFYHRSSQGNASSHVPGPPGFRAGADSPFLGSMGEEGRVHTPSHYRRSVDPNIARAHGNHWKGVPNWPSPLPNGFLPFPPGLHLPTPGGFPGMITPFPSPPIFGGRPSMEMNHHGLPYLSDLDRFSSHMRPLGWQNMVDGSGPRLHRWDASIGVSGDNPMFGPGYMSNGRAREANVDIWKQTGDINSSLGPVLLKDEIKTKASADEAFLKQELQGSHRENELTDDQVKNTTVKMSNDISRSKAAPDGQTKVATEKSPESPAADNTAHCLHVYISKLDIPVELVHPELYNQCKSLAVEKQHDDVLEDVIELELSEQESLATDSEISDRSTLIPFFPFVEASIFQRALNLYNAHSMRRGTLAVTEGENLHALTSFEGDADKQISALKVKEGTTDTQMFASDEEMKGNLAALIELDETASSLDNFELREDPYSKSLKLEMQALGPEIAESSGSASDPINVNLMDPPSPEIIDRRYQSLNRIMAADGKEDKSNLVGKSGSIVLPGDSVNICESVMPVANDSESVILDRIHPPAESIH
ncbi:hypothetical protein Dimus_028175 [Dionaea muscipula]